MESYAFDNTTTSRSFGGIMSTNTAYLGCRAYHYTVDGGKHVYYWNLFEGEKINARREKYFQKKLLKKVREKLTSCLFHHTNASGNVCVHRCAKSVIYKKRMLNK